MSHNQENKTCIHVGFGSFVVCCFSTSSSYNREKFEVYQNFWFGREVIFAKDQLSSSPAWGHPVIPKSRRIMRSFWVLKNNHSAGAEHWSSVKCSNVFKNPQVGRKIVRWLMAFLVTQNWSICAFRFSSLTQWIQFPSFFFPLWLNCIFSIKWDSQSFKGQNLVGKSWI